MTETTDFKCLKCATCCRTLLDTNEGVTRGLPLTQQETKLFPKDCISPKLAIGETKPVTIILFQLNTSCCPHLDNQNFCTLHGKHPLACKSFPIVAGAISNRCKVFSYRKVGTQYNEPYNMTAQMEASDKLLRYIETRLKNRKTKLWEFNLSTKKWINKGFYKEKK